MPGRGKSTDMQRMKVSFNFGGQRVYRFPSVPAESQGKVRKKLGEGAVREKEAGSHRERDPQEEEKKKKIVCLAKHTLFLTLEAFKLHNGGPVWAISERHYSIRGKDN